jgi:hypothetical protein
MKKHFFLSLLWLLVGCDNNAIVNNSNKTFMQTPITCMRLQVFPEDKTITQTLMKRYNFKNDCNLTLDVTFKSGIKCNSTHNVIQKNLSNFPTSYLKMEFKRGFNILYSYYIDLNDAPDRDDVNDGFDRLEKDLKIKI